MRNVTVSLDESTVSWAKARAAHEDLSLSRYVASLLEKERCKDADYEAAMTGFFAVPVYPLRSDPSERYPTREELYDRPGVR